jgi:hypothetical protein
MSFSMAIAFSCSSLRAVRRARRRWLVRPHVRFQPGQPGEGKQDQGSALDPPRAEPLEPAMAVTSLLRSLCPMTWLPP